jgi:hypothetical protein
MESGSDEQLPHRIRNYTFPENLGGGVFTNLYLSVENQDDDGIDALLKSVQSPKLDPAEALRHLQLPKDDFDFQKFTQILIEIGYGISSGVEGISRNKREYTKAIGREGSRALLYIPEEILLNPSLANLDSINSICSAFTKKAVLIVFTKTSEVVDDDVKGIIEQNWPDTDRIGKIIYWKSVKRLIKEYDRLKNERDPTARAQILDDIKKITENMLEGLMPLKDS